MSFGIANAARHDPIRLARFEAGGTVPALPVLERLARAIDLELAHRDRRVAGPDNLGRR